MTYEGSVIRHAFLLIAFMPALAACASASAPASSDGAPSGGRPSTAASPPFATVPPPSGSPVIGEVPADVMAKVTADLATRTGLDPATFTFVRAEQVIWADGSLGCPIPGQVYIQVQTPGYWIVITANGKTYDFRATQTGALQLCEGLQPQPPSG